MRLVRAASRFVACGLVLHANVAAAQRWPVAPEPLEPPCAATPPMAAAPAEAPPAQQTRWYGWQTFVADAGALGFAALALGTSSANGSDAAAFVPLAVGGGSYLLGGPIVHAAHGHWGKAGGSLALRVGLPLLGWAAGYALSGDSCRREYAYDHEGCPFENAAYGLILGAVSAMILDAVLLGRERVDDGARGAPSVAFTPLNGGGNLSLAGRF
jgi:hypothetical protein